jgi:hypothetical protein
VFTKTLYINYFFGTALFVKEDRECSAVSKIFYRLNLNKLCAKRLTGCDAMQFGM